MQNADLAMGGWLRTGEAAQRLHRSREWVLQQIGKGRLEAIRVDPWRLVSVASVERLQRELRGAGVL